MVMTPIISNLPLTVIDANVLTALCAKEPNKYARAKIAVEQRALKGSLFYAPGVIVAETLFALCRQLADGILTPTEHAQAVQSLDIRMGAILPPPNGDAMLVLRAEQIRGSYGCSRSADGLYLALLEDLATFGRAELLTFDVALKTQALIALPALMVTLLPLDVVSP